MFLIVSASPHKGGITEECALAARRGFLAAEEPSEWIRLNEIVLCRCHVCDELGWGACRTESRCAVEDGFQQVHQKIREARAVVLVTPVYWGEPAEPMKAMLDRLRRCEALSGGLKGKPFVYVAEAGGSGNGTVSTLEIFERWNGHVGARRIDMIPVTRLSKPYKLKTIAAACENLARQGGQ